MRYIIFLAIIFVIPLITSCEETKEEVIVIDEPIIEIFCAENQVLFGICIDKTDPVLTGVEDIEVLVGSEFDLLYLVQAIDDVDGDITDQIVVDGELNTNETGLYFIKYSITDSHNNSITKVRYITVVTTLENVHNYGFNLVLNGDFSDGLNGWTNYIDYETVANMFVANGVANIEITAVSEVLFSPRLDYQGMTFYNGRRYEVSFDAWSLNPRIIHVLIGELIPQEPWFYLFNNNKKFFDLTTTQQTFTFDFIMNEESCFNSAILFEMGTVSGSNNFETTVFLDNISIAEIEK